VFSATHDNIAEENIASGNANGIVIGPGTHGNVLQRNLVVGNPPVQVSVENTSTDGKDIRNESDPGAVTFEDNRCLTYAGPAPAPCPDVGREPREEDKDDKDAAARGSKSLLFSQATLIDAALRGARQPRASTASAQPRRRPDSAIVTVTGKVVDAACFMLHAAASTAASHKDCSTACLARGVPLAIAADDGTLYFPSDGNQRLKSLLNARVRASGTVVEKHDPMELKMPVGDKNQMVVRVEGGYKQIAIQTLEKISPAKHPPA
jgi:parallel beta-helix repeat protein